MEIPNLLIQSSFQSGCAQGGQMHLGQAVFHGEHEGFGQLITGHHLALLLRLTQKFPGPPGGGGVVQIKDADDGFVTDSHIIADGEKHKNLRFFIHIYQLRKKFSFSAY